MSTATLTPLPPMPTHPAAYAELVRHNNAAVVSARAATRRYVAGQGSWAQVQSANAAAKTWQELCAQWWATDEGVAYRAQIDAHDAAVHARRAHRAAEAQAAVNRRTTAAVRSAACPSCFTTHAGEC